MESMQCLVCALPTQYFHRKILACRACSAFFQRSIQLGIVLKCRKSQNCDVTKDNRVKCRFCRMERCLAVGMSEENSSLECNGDSNEASELEKGEKKMGGENFFTVEHIVNNGETFFSELEQRINLILRKGFIISDDTSDSLCKQTLDSYAHLTTKWPSCQNKTLLNSGRVKATQMFCEYFQILEQSAEMCMKCLKFAELPEDQRRLVYKNFMLHFPQMFRIFNTIDWLGHDVTDYRCVIHSGISFDYRTSDLVFDGVNESSRKEIRNIIKKSTKSVHSLFLRPYKRLFADNFERAFFIARRIWLLEGVEGLTPETLDKASEVRNHLSEELHNYYIKEKKLLNYASRIYKISNLLISLDRVKEIREKDRAMSHMFGMFKVDLHAWHKNAFK